MTDIKENTWIGECIDVLGRIARGDVDDHFTVEDGYSHDAWELYKTVWPNDAPQGIHPTPYQRRVLQEMWYTLEAYDPRLPVDSPDPLDDLAVDREYMRETARMCHDMLTDPNADPLFEPFPDWLNYANSGIPKDGILRSADIILHTWPKYKSSRVYIKEGPSGGAWHEVTSIDSDGLDVGESRFERGEVVILSKLSEPVA